MLDYCTKRLLLEKWLENEWLPCVTALSQSLCLAMVSQYYCIATETTKLTSPPRCPKLRSQNPIHPRRQQLPPLNRDDTKYIQAVAGTLLYYGRAINNTILIALSAVAIEQAKPTQKTMEIIKQLLDYCAMQKDAIISYRASKMILAVHSDAGYCNEKIEKPSRWTLFSQQ